MSITNAIPTLWAARLLVNLHKAQVYGQRGVVNRDYEGEIRAKGDAVKIVAIGPISVTAFTKNTDISGPDALVDASTMLNIDQGYYFNFQIDDVDRAQAAVEPMDEAMREASYALSDTADAYIAAAMAAGAHFSNLIGTSGSPITLTTADDAYEYLVDLGTRLSEQNIPTQGRWCIVPPWVHGLMRKDARFVGYGTQANMDVLMNGVIGKAAGFTLYESNNVPNTTGTAYKIIAGYPGAVTYAEQVLEIEAYRPPARFADAVKGLHVYGAKVIRPAGLAVLTANKS